MRRTRRTPKRSRATWPKVLLVTGLLLALFIGFSLLGEQPASNVPLPGTAQDLAKKSSAALDTASKAVDAAGTKKDALKARLKTGATPLMEKFHTVMNIDAIIATRRQEPTWVSLKGISPHVSQALIAIEDHDFYNHGAIDLTGILRAALANFNAGEVVQGGSTLSQQMVKNVFLSDEQSFSRKAEEAALAFRIEHQYTKDEILELYLNTTYLGHGAYGIQEAAETYFDKDPKELSLGEACVIAALPYAPSALDPYKNSKGCAKRMRLVLSNMQKYNMVTSAAAERARFAGVTLKDGTFLSFKE